MTKSSTQRTNAYRDRLRAAKPSKTATKITRQRGKEWRSRKKTLDNDYPEAMNDPLCLPTSTTIQDEECSAMPSPKTESSMDYIVPNADFDPEMHIDESEKNFLDNTLGMVCFICDRTWLKNDSDAIGDEHRHSISATNSDLNMKEIVVCDACKPSLNQNTIIKLPKSDDSVDPQIPINSPQWDLVSERLIEKWITNDKVDTSSSDCVTQLEGINTIAEGVSVYQDKNNDSTNIATHNMDVTYRQINTVSLNIQGIGEICAGECSLPNGDLIIKAYVYILPNQPMVKIIDFIYFNLLPYTVVGAALLRKNFDKVPMILSGNFNVDFKSEDARTLIEFMLNKFSLQHNTDPRILTTKSYSSIDAVFQRYLDRLKSTVLVSYFDEEKPIISCIPSGNHQVSE